MMTVEELRKRIGWTGRMFSGGALRVLPSALMPGEEILAGAACNSGSASGLLVATNQRVLFVNASLGSSGTTDVMYSAVHSVSPQKGMGGNRLTIASPAGRMELSSINANDMDAIVQAIHSRRSA